PRAGAHGAPRRGRHGSGRRVRTMKAKGLPMHIPNLTLIPHSPEHLRALISGSEQYEKSFGIPPAAGLHDFIVSAEVSPEWLARLETAAAGPDPWEFGFAVVHAADRAVI